MIEMMARFLTLETSEHLNVEISHKHGVSKHEGNISKCDFVCKLEGTLRKHINTKYAAMSIKCVLCDYKFSTHKACNDHLAEHREEIRLMEPKYLQKGQETLECKICDVISKNANAIKIHLLEHVN